MEYGGRTSCRRRKRLSTLTLDDTEDQLASARDLLDKTNSTLKLTQEERDALQAQLVEKLAALAELNSKLEALLSEKSVLEAERQSLVNARDALLREKAAARRRRRRVERHEPHFERAARGSGRRS